MLQRTRNGPPVHGEIATYKGHRAIFIDGYWMVLVGSIEDRVSNLEDRVDRLEKNG